MNNGELKGILLPYQFRWLNDESPVIVWEKSRRIGASYADSLKSVLVAAKKREDGGMNVNYISYNKYMTRQYVEDAAMWAKRVSAAAGEIQEMVMRDDDKDIITYQIKFASGHRIQALSSQPRSLRSTQGRVVLDEFAFVDAPQELLKAALALGMWGGQIAILSTHNGADNPFYELVEDIKSGRLPYRLHKTDFNEAVDQGLYKAVCRALKKQWNLEDEERYKADIISQYGEAAEEELFCIARKSGGAYIALNLIEAAMNLAPDMILRVEPPASDFLDWPKAALEEWAAIYAQEEIAPILNRLNKRLRHVAGLDVGRVSDLSSLICLSEDEDLSRSVALVLEMNNMPFNVQLALVNGVFNGLPEFSGAAVDATGIGASMAESLRQEWGPELIHEIKLSDCWYSTNMPPLKAHFEDKTMNLPKDAFLRDDLRRIKKINGVPKIEAVRVKTGQGFRHGDGAVALALADFALKNAPDITMWEPVLPGPSETSLMLESYNR